MSDERTRPVILGPNALSSAAHALGDYSCWVNNDTRIEDVLKPIFWQNHVQLLSTRIGSRLTVLRRDMSLDVQLRLVGIKDGLVSVRVLTKFVDDSNLPKIAAGREAAAAESRLEDPVGYKTGHAPNGADAGFWVQLKNPNEQGPPKFLKKGFKSKAEAIAFANAHKAAAESVPA